MDIKRPPPGHVAPKDSDCIKITRIGDGRFALITSALSQCGDDEEAVSEAVISSSEYGSHEQAEQAGLAWAESHCAGVLYIELD